MEQSVSPVLEAESPASYSWEVPGKPLAVRLDFGAVDRILAEVMRGFGSVPKRGAEVGGLLLGTVTQGDPVIVHILDFEPVLSEHARGPSYLLSPADETRLTAAIERYRGSNGGGNRQVVGFVRSHTRDRLGLSEDDLALFDKYFPEPHQVFLLVKPYAARASVGGFFFREEGLIRSDSSYLEFPFRRKDLGGGVAPPPKPASPAPESVSHVAASFGAEPGLPPRRSTILPLFDDPAAIVSTPPMPPMETPKPRRNVWIPLSFIFLLVGVVLGFQTALSFRPAGASRAPQDPLTLSLTAAKADDTIQLRWDRQSPAILRARGGRLTIADGSHTQSLDLDSGQLQNGAVIYRYLTGVVSFRLEVYSQDRSSLVENVEVHTGAAAASPGDARARETR
jgi:hypothetical protein